MFQDEPGVQIAGIHSRTRVRDEEMAARFDIPTVCDSVSELHDITKADLVVVTVPELAMNAMCLLRVPLDGASRKVLEAGITPVAWWTATPIHCVASLGQAFKPGFRLQAQEVVAATLDQPSNLSTLDEAIETMKIIENIFES